MRTCTIGDGLLRQVAQAIDAACLRPPLRRIQHHVHAEVHNLGLRQFKVVLVLPLEVHHFRLGIGVRAIRVQPVGIVICYRAGGGDDDECRARYPAGRSTKRLPCARVPVSRSRAQEIWSQGR